jgi:hypothetical protein
MEPSVSLYRREHFHQFLYSVIREEEGGASLTVLSALARRNLDPWEAAEELARVPWAVAATQLSALIAIPLRDTTVPQIPDPLVIDLLAKLPRPSIVERPTTVATWASLTHIAMRLKARLKSRS